MGSVIWVIGALSWCYIGWCAFEIIWPEAHVLAVAVALSCVITAVRMCIRAVEAVE